MNKLNESLISILRCPKSLAPLKQIEDQLVSSDPKSRLSFPIKNGIPILLLEEAKKIEKDVWEKIFPQAKE